MQFGVVGTTRSVVNGDESLCVGRGFVSVCVYFNFKISCIMIFMIQLKNDARKLDF